MKYQKQRFGKTSKQNNLLKWWLRAFSIDSWGSSFWKALAPDNK